MSIKNSLYLIVFIMIYASCLDPFTFDNENRDSSIVIDGQLNTGDGPHILRISNVLAFGDKYFDPVQGASVTLHHDSNTYPYVEIEPGIHSLSKGIINGIPGESYYISVVLPNGDNIRSIPETMPKEFKLDSINTVFNRKVVLDRFGIERRQLVIDVSVNAVFPEIENGEPFYLRYGIEEDYSYTEPSCGGLHQPKTCYIKEQSFTKDFTLFNSEIASRANIDSLLVLTKFDLSGVQFRGKHYFSVFQYSITESAFDYWSNVKQVTNQEGTVFDLPPASVPGNLINETDQSHQILGYFELTALNVSRNAIFPFEYFDRSADQDECSIFNRRNWPDRCCQCLLLENATVNRPPWF